MGLAGEPGAGTAFGPVGRPNWERTGDSGSSSMGQTSAWQACYVRAVARGMCPSHLVSPTPGRRGTAMPGRQDKPTSARVKALPQGRSWLCHYLVVTAATPTFFSPGREVKAGAGFRTTVRQPRLGPSSAQRAAWPEPSDGTSSLGLIVNKIGT